MRAASFRKQNASRLRGARDLALWSKTLWKRSDESQGAFFQKIFLSENLTARSDGGEEIDADRSQVRRWELGLVARVGLQSGFASAIEKDRQLHQVLIRESVRAVVSHGRRFVQVRGCELGRQGVQLQYQQSESADVGGPAPQMPHQI